jgi:hypothetical protein
MMLDHLGHEDAGAGVVSAIERVLGETEVRTPDLNGIGHYERGDRRHPQRSGEDPQRGSKEVAVTRCQTRKRSVVDMRIGRVEFDPESGVITQVLGRSYRDREEARTHVRRELSEYMEWSA